MGRRGGADHHRFVRHVLRHTAGVRVTPIYWFAAGLFVATLIGRHSKNDGKRTIADAVKETGSIAMALLLTGVVAAFVVAFVLLVVDLFSGGGFDLNEDRSDVFGLAFVVALAFATDAVVARAR